MTKNLTPEKLIIQIGNAVKIEDLLPKDFEKSNFKSEFNSLISLIHPDICNLPGAVDAASKLNKLRNEYEKGKTYQDEVGEFTTNGYHLHHTGGTIVLAANVGNYQKLVHAAKGKTPHLLNYLPKDMSLTSEGLVVTFNDRAVPLSKMSLPQEHVNWILSRLLEFSVMTSALDFVHCGLNPESVFIVPETHGIIVTSFYHLSGLGCKVETINAAYKNWYPAKLFVEKIAYSAIDLELSKKIAINLLGDSSGSGIRLKKDHNEAWIDFVIQQDNDPIECYDNYRRILKQNFKSQFHTLKI